MSRGPPEFADHSAAESEKTAMSGPPAAFVMMSAPSCAVEQGSLSVRETALDSDFCETKVSGMAGPSNG